MTTKTFSKTNVMDGASTMSRNPNFKPGYHAPEFDGVNADLPDAYHNDVDPPKSIKIIRENQAHRLMIFMAANAYNYTEIAEKTGYSNTYVSNVLRQPWARARIQEEQRSSGMDELRKMLAPQATGAFMRLVKLGEEANSESVKADVNKYIVNRYLGMPTQPVESVGKDAAEMTDDELKNALANALPQLGASDRMPAMSNDIDGERSESLHGRGTEGA